MHVLPSTLAPTNMEAHKGRAKILQRGLGLGFHVRSEQGRVSAPNPQLRSRALSRLQSWNILPPKRAGVVGVPWKYAQDHFQSKTDVRGSGQLSLCVDSSGTIRENTTKSLRCQTVKPNTPKVTLRGSFPDPARSEKIDVKGRKKLGGAKSDSPSKQGLLLSGGGPSEL